MDNGHRRLLAKPDKDPAQIEQELVQLREDCSSLIRELEGRYESVMRVPREVAARTRRVERVFDVTVRRQVGRHPVTVVAGAIAIGAGFAILRFAVFERPRRVFLVDERRVRRFTRRLERFASLRAIFRFFASVRARVFRSPRFVDVPAWVWALPARERPLAIEGRRTWL